MSVDNGIKKGKTVMAPQQNILQKMHLFPLMIAMNTGVPTIAV